MREVVQVTLRERVILHNIEGRVEMHPTSRMKLSIEFRSWHACSHEIIQYNVALTRLTTRIIKAMVRSDTSVHTIHRMKCDSDTDAHTIHRMKCDSDTDAHTIIKAMVRSYTSDHTIHRMKCDSDTSDNTDYKSQE